MDGDKIYTKEDMIGFGTYVLNNHKSGLELTEDDIEQWKEHPCSNYASDAPKGQEAGSPEGAGGKMELVDNSESE